MNMTERKAKSKSLSRANKSGKSATRSKSAPKARAFEQITANTLHAKRWVQEVVTRFNKRAALEVRAGEPLGR